MNTTTQTLATTAPSADNAPDTLTALWLQPGMQVAFAADGATATGQVTAVAAEPFGPEIFGARGHRIVVTLDDGAAYGLMPAHACRVISGRELARMVFDA